MYNIGTANVTYNYRRDPVLLLLFDIIQKYLQTHDLMDSNNNVQLIHIN